MIIFTDRIGPVLSHTMPQEPGKRKGKTMVESWCGTKQRWNDSKGQKVARGRSSQPSGVWVSLMLKAASFTAIWGLWVLWFFLIFHHWLGQAGGHRCPSEWITNPEEHRNIITSTWPPIATMAESPLCLHVSTMSGPEGTKRPWLSWTAPPQASAPCKLHPLLSQGILAYIWSALWPVLRSASCVFHHWPSGMDPKAVLQVVLCLVLALLFLLCCKIYGIGSHVSKVGFYFLDCAPWPEPRSSSHFVWSGNISGTGHCHCPSPAYGQRGEAIALSLLELTSALVLFPWVQQWPSNSSLWLSRSY